MLWKLLSRTNHEEIRSEVISLTAGGAMKERIEELGVPVTVIGMSRSPSALAGLPRLRRALSSNRPDLVQTWMYHADLFGGLAAKSAGVPGIVWGIRQSNLGMSLNRTSTLLIARACAMLSRRVPSRIVCVSHASLTSHAAIGYAAEKMVVIPNGFDTERFRPDPEARLSVRSELGLEPQTRIIGMVARFDPQKDHRTFIEAAGRLGLTERNVAFVVVGEGIDWNNQQLVTWIDQAGVRSAVRLLGRREDIPRLTASFDLATSSSVGEGFSNVIGEAMASEVPCVVTDVGDSAAIAGDTGLVISPGDITALAEGWRRLLGDHELRLRLGSAARRRVLQEYSLDAVAARYHSLYLEVLACAA